MIGGAEAVGEEPRDTTAPLGLVVMQAGEVSFLLVTHASLL